MTHEKTMAVVWGEVPPAFSIGHDTPLGSWDSGFTVLFDDVPEPDEVDDVNDHLGISLVCLRCLLDDHPEIGRGLDIAREPGRRPRTRTASGLSAISAGWSRD